MHTYVLEIELRSGKRETMEVKSRETQPRRVVGANEGRLQKKFGYEIVRVTARKA